jgi:glycosyltransferase involved in cell wall biosynthesis
MLDQTLHSVAAQTYENWECIVIDDLSTDSTKELLGNIIEKDNRFQYYKKPKELPKGPNSCRNFGFTKAKGDWIQWFDSDDILEPNALEIYQRYFTKHTDAVIAKLQRFDFKNQLIKSVNENFSKNLIEDYFTGKVVFYVCCPVWNTNFLMKQNLLFDEQISNLDDWDFNLRMLYQNPKINYIKDILIKYRIHSESLSHEIEKLNFSEVKSEINTRKTHHDFLKSNSRFSQKNTNNFMVTRFKYLLREALIKKHTSKKYLFVENIKLNIKLGLWKEVIKISLGFLSYSFFKKGYKLLK